MDAIAVQPRVPSADLAAISTVALEERDARWLARIEALERELRSLREQLAAGGEAGPESVPQLLEGT